MKSLFRVVALAAIRVPLLVGSLAATLALTLALTLAGCATTVALAPAPDAVNPLCATVVVRLPDTAGGLPIHDTNAQGTGAWGSPSAAILHCGVANPGPTSTLPCVLVGDVYWLRDDSNAPNYVFTTYGRLPATQVVVNQTKASPGSVLYDLVAAIDATKPTGHRCSSIEDSLGSSATPAPGK